MFAISFEELKHVAEKVAEMKEHGCVEAINMKCTTGNNCGCGWDCSSEKT